MVKLVALNNWLNTVYLVDVTVIFFFLSGLKLTKTSFVVWKWQSCKFKTTTKVLFVYKLYVFVKL